MTKQDLNNQHQNLKADIANLKGFISCELEVHGKDARLNWGHIGDLNQIKEKMLETLAALMGTEPDAIRDEINTTLQETRN
ncbi:MAG: hypothetical protein JEZ07_08865 [Phycisphaerae bacterium]|nr:hypothetical protein [Phycisphaerae bacterium]